MRFSPHLVFLLLLTMTGAFLMIPGASAITCESCHSSSGGDGGYSYKDPIIRMVHDPFFTPGSRFEVSLVIIPQNNYDMRSISGELSFSGDHVSLVSASDLTGEVRDDGRAAVTWTFDALSEGSSDIDVSMKYEVYYQHESGGNKDIGTYFDDISTTVEISDRSLSISPGSLILTESGEQKQITITAKNEVTGIAVDVPPSLQNIIEVTVPDTELGPGDTSTVTVTLVNGTNIEDDIDIRWTEGPSDMEVPVTITVVKLVSDTGGKSIYLKIGRLTGIAATVLMLLGYFSGGTGFMKKHANRIFKTAARRIKFHCRLSYLIMKLSVFHLVVLIYGPYRESIFDWEVVLGWLAILTMVIIAVNGIFQRKFIKLFGYENWRRVHAWGTYIATGLVIVHMISYGGHFAWLREMIGMQ